MAKIVITNGTYGYRPEEASIPEPKVAGDLPFEVSDEEAERLIGLKVAKYAEEAVATAQKATAGASTGSGVSKEENQDKAGSTAVGVPYSAGSKATELRTLMKELGLPINFGMTKEQMIAALDDYYAGASKNAEGTDEDGAEDDAENDEEDAAEDDGEEPPTPKAAAPEV